jgi:dTMP kinase
MTRGTLIAIEGIDGSGKRTQLDLLNRALVARGVATIQFSFPRYETSFGKLVARYLNGDFGSLDEVDPHFSALLYANNRLEVKPELDLALATGKFILMDRYVGSNLAHQASRVPAASRDDFVSWLTQLEYQLYGLPTEDLVVYLRIPAPTAQQLVGRKAARAYTTLTRDLHEADLEHLQRAAEIYDHLATQPNWQCIDCMDASSDALLSPDEIHQQLLKTVETRILPGASSQSERRQGNL